MALTSVLLLVLRWVTVAGMLFVCARLLHFGLHRRYRVFCAYLGFSACRSGILLALDVGSGTYMKIWICTEPMLWVLYILLVLELYSLILQDHQGLYTVGRWAMYGAVVLAVLSGVASLAPPAHMLLNDNTLVAFYVLTSRALRFSLLVFLVVLLWFISRYPVTLSRNVVIHCVVYSTYFLSTSLVFLVRSTIGYQVQDSINVALTAIGAGCVVAWGVFLTADGERRAGTLHFSLHADRERHLVQQLDTLNTALLRVARK